MKKSSVTAKPTRQPRMTAKIPLQRIAEHRLPGLLHQDAARG
ncbi:MAG: hypothetical protein ACOXZ7_09700 [Sphaerochaeta sp.]